MEKMIEKLSIPFWIVAAAVVAIFIVQFKNHYYQGKLAQLRYEKESKS